MAIKYSSWNWLSIPLLLVSWPLGEYCARQSAVSSAAAAPSLPAGRPKPKPLTAADLAQAWLKLPNVESRVSASMEHWATCPLDELLGIIENKGQPWLADRAVWTVAADRLLAEAPDQLARLIPANTSLDMAVRNWLPTKLQRNGYHLTSMPGLASAEDRVAYLQAMKRGDFAAVRQMLASQNPPNAKAMLFADFCAAGGDFKKFATSLGGDVAKLRQVAEMISLDQKQDVVNFCLAASPAIRESLLETALHQVCESSNNGKLREFFQRLTPDEQRRLASKMATSGTGRLATLEDYDAIAAALGSDNPRELLRNSVSTPLRGLLAKRDLPVDSEQRREDVLAAVESTARDSIGDRQSWQNAAKLLEGESAETIKAGQIALLAAGKPGLDTTMLAMLRGADPGHLSAMMRAVPVWLWERESAALEALRAQLPPEKQERLDNHLASARVLEAPNSPEAVDFFRTALAKDAGQVQEQFRKWSRGREQQALQLLAESGQHDFSTEIGVFFDWYQLSDEAAAGKAYQARLSQLPLDQARKLLKQGREQGFSNFTSLATVPTQLLQSDRDWQGVAFSQAALANQAEWASWEASLSAEQRAFPAVQKLFERRKSVAEMQRLVEEDK